ncbi:MAG: DUF4327 family protein [Microcystaceae cyanobacterium]
MLNTLPRYTLNDIKEEAKELVYQGRLSRQQCLYTLCGFLPSGSWADVEAELEKNDFLLRDHLIDLLHETTWDSD